MTDIKLSSDVKLSPFYHSAFNEITKPSSLVFVSHYFVDRWMPDLGPTATAILICLRSHCYHNRATGETRDQIQISLPDIAKECSISYKTVQREIAGNKALQRFVRVQEEYAPGKTAASVRRDSNSYQVAMDDPIHPDDDQQLIEIVRAKEAAREKGGSTEEAKVRAGKKSAAAQNSASQKPLGQIVPAAYRPDNLSPPPGQIVPTPPDRLSSPSGQIVPALIDSSLSQENSLESAAGALEFSLSLFEEKEPEPDQAPAPPWSSLSEAAQRHYIERARTELQAACEGVAPNPLIVEARGRNLYHLAHRR